MEGEEFIDGSEDAAWAFKRGSKRGLAADEDDEGYESTGGRGDKRPRNVSRNISPEDQLMEDEEMDADDITDLRSIPRGKKRGRGSTFGGDDDESEQLDDKASRRRKRKMLSKRKSEAAQPQEARGKKRDRDVEGAYDSDEEDMKRSRSSRRKSKGKGKKTGEDDGGNGSDVSMNESLVSRSSYVKGRMIDEEWEVNGVRFKVGPNGQRLRQALVKMARNKFPMVCITSGTDALLDGTNCVCSLKILSTPTVMRTWKFLSRDGSLKKNTRMSKTVMNWHGKTRLSHRLNQKHLEMLKILHLARGKIFFGRPQHKSHLLLNVVHSASPLLPTSDCGLMRSLRLRHPRDVVWHLHIALCPRAVWKVLPVRADLGRSQNGKNRIWKLKLWRR